MGVNLKDLFERREIALEDLSGKTIAMDAFNIIYQFLTTIRTRDGRLLTDSKGHVTSHLIGLLTRTSHLLQLNIASVFVFDGKPPKLKASESERRHELKQEALKLYRKAAEEEDVASMRKYAARASFLTGEMIEDAKRLLNLMGLPVVQAPSEGEAQCTFIAKQGDAWAVGSQDYDSLLYATPRLVQNLSIAGRRKKAGALSYVSVNPQVIELEPNLKRLGISQDQLIALAMLVGTDYNPGGVKGIGPKNALKLVKKHGSNFEALFEEAAWDCKTSWKEIFNLFKNMPVSNDYDLELKTPDKEGILQFLAEERDFSRDRVAETINKIIEVKKKKSQKGSANQRFAGLSSPEAQKGIGDF